MADDYNGVSFTPADDPGSTYNPFGTGNANVTQQQAAPPGAGFPTGGTNTTSTPTTNYNAFISGGGSPFDFYNQQSQGGSNADVVGGGYPTSPVTGPGSSVAQSLSGGPRQVGPGLPQGPQGGSVPQTGPNANGYNGSMTGTVPGANPGTTANNPLSQGNAFTQPVNTGTQVGSTLANGQPTPPIPTGNPGTDALAAFQYAQAMATWTAANGVKTGATPPATTPPGFSATNPFGTANPFQTNPTGTGPNGSYNFNQTYFPTEATAQTVAQMAGGTVVANPNGLLSAPGSPFTQNQTSYQVRLPNGTIINPGNIASYYQNYSDPSQANQLKNLVTGELTGQGITDTAYENAFKGQGVQIPYTPTGQGSDTQTPVWNAFTQQPTKMSDLAFANPGGVNPSATGNTTPAAAPASTPATTTPQGSGNMDYSSLMNALLFLNAYQGLGSGAGNPTGVNQNGQLGSIISQLLSGIYGDQSLYSRQRQYPAFQ